MSIAPLDRRDLLMRANVLSNHVLKVAILFEYQTLNGGERSMLAALAAARELDSPRLDPIALAPRIGPLSNALAKAGVTHVPFDVRGEDGKPIPRESRVERLVEVARQVRPDLLHANSLSMGRMTGAAASLVGVPTTSHLRDIIGLSVAAIGELNQNRRLIAVSDATRDFHLRHGITDRIDVIRNGIDLREFSPRPRTGWLKRSLGLSESDVLAATIGQIALRKGHDTLAEAAVVAARELPHVHYVWIGERHSTKPESIEFERRAKARFDEAGLSGRLHCLGNRDDVSALLPEVDLLVHPARQEPLGRVLIEAAACGTPIVATDVGGTSEVVEDGTSARLVPPDQPVALAAAIVELAANPSLRRCYAEAARRGAEERFDVRTSAGRLIEFWRSVAVPGDGG